MKREGFKTVLATEALNFRFKYFVHRWIAQARTCSCA
jgi:hypothetical protein